MSAIFTEILFILLLVIANGVFAMSEIAIVSARKARLLQWANEGDSKAETALELANSPNRFLSTVQIGITLVGILAGTFGGATIAARLASQLSQIRWLEPYSEPISVGIVVVCITYLTLVIGELAPKRLGLQAPEKISRAVAGPMRGLSTVTAPIVHLLSISTDAVLRLLGIQLSTQAPVSEEEIKLLIDQATQAGIFEETEQDMVEGVLRLNNRWVGALMTPRLEIDWLDLDASTEEISQQISNTPHTRFPVCREDLDNVQGIVRAKHLLNRCLTGQPLDLKSLMVPPLFVPETIMASTVLELFKQSELDIALVTDEYGGLQGLVTINDILEVIVGDIEMDSPRAVPRKDGSWLLDGMLPVDELKEIFQIKQLPGEERNNYQTVGGFVMMRLGRIPSATDGFRWNNLHFEVVDMDGRRVDKILVMEVPTADPE